MNVKARLFRRPFTTILWSVLLTAVALLVGVGSVLNYSAQNLLPMLDDNHTTIALRTDRASESIETDMGAIWTMESKFFTQDDYDYFMSLDSVRDIYFHSLTGGHIPELVPTLALLNKYGNVSECYDQANESYDQVILVGTVRRILDETEVIPTDLSTIGLGQQEPSKTIYVEVQIDEVVSAHPDYPFSGSDLYTGVINCSINLCGEDAADYIQIGNRYLICGSYDPQVSAQNGWPQDANHPSLTVSFNVVMQNDSLWSYRYGYSFEENAATNLICWPVVARLDGTLSDFLNNPDNSGWVEYIESCDSALHNMPIIGTENLNSIYLFHSGDASIVAGRMFTEDEYISGEKVCILSETVANKAGIDVGDTIHISQFTCNEVYNTSISSNAADGMMNNPTVGEPMSDIRYVTQDVEFMVVGIYRQTNEWEQTSYSFMPNTVFIPKKSQISGGFGDLSTTYELTGIDMEGNEFSYTMVTERGCYGVYFSILLKNGRVDDFALAISGTEWENQFHTFDQGYDGVISNMNSMTESTYNLFLFAVAGWVMVLVLYVLLYQNGQRKNLGIMRSLGAKPRQTRAYLFGSGFGLSVICVIAGTVLTALLTGVINNKLLDLLMAEATMEQHSGGMELSQASLAQMIMQSQLPTHILALLAGIQLLVIAVVLWLHAGALAKKTPRKLLGV